MAYKIVLAKPKPVAPRRRSRARSSPLQKEFLSTSPAATTGRSRVALVHAERRPRRRGRRRRRCRRTPPCGVVTDELTGLPSDDLITRRTRHALLERSCKAIEHTTDEEVTKCCSPTSQCSDGGMTMSDESPDTLPERRPRRAADRRPTACGGRRRPCPRHGDLALVLDVPVELVVEIGRTTMTIRETLGIAPGTIIVARPARRRAGRPARQRQRIARGEVVAIDEEFGLRVTTEVGRQSPRRSGLGRAQSTWAAVRPSLSATCRADPVPATSRTPARETPRTAARSTNATFARPCSGGAATLEPASRRRGGRRARCGARRGRRGRRCGWAPRERRALRQPRGTSQRRRWEGDRRRRRRRAPSARRPAHASSGRSARRRASDGRAATMPRPPSRERPPRCPPGRGRRRLRNAVTTSGSKAMRRALDDRPGTPTWGRRRGPVPAGARHRVVDSATLAIRAS